jgi:hypothetical protein
MHIEESTGMIAAHGGVVILLKLLNVNVIHKRSTWDAP